MAKHSIDSIVKKVVLDSNDYYISNALEAKDRIWNEVCENNRNTNNTILRLLATACAVLLLISIGLSFSHFASKKSFNALAKVTKDLKAKTQEQAKLISSIDHQELIVYENTSDTVFVFNNEIVYKIIEKTNTKIDTVFIKQIEVVEKEVPTQTFISKNANLNSNINTQIILIDEEISTQRVKRKLKIKFWGNPDQVCYESLAISTRQ